MLQKGSTPGSQGLLDLIEGNHPVLYADPINQDTVYVHHAFGVHALQFESLLRSLAIALRDDTSDKGGTPLEESLQKAKGTDVHPLLSTLDVQSRYVHARLRVYTFSSSGQVFEPNHRRSSAKRRLSNI